MSYQELRSVVTWSDVKELYASKGHRFTSDEQCLEAIRADWRRWVQLAVASAVTAPHPSEYPVERVEVAGMKFDIIGIFHSTDVHSDVKRLLQSALAKHPVLLAEQNLGVLNGARFSSGIDIPDHFARGWVCALLEAQKVALEGAGEWCCRQVHRAIHGRKISRDVPPEFVRPLMAKAAATTSDQVQQIVQPNRSAFHSHLSLMTPGDILEPLPTHIDLAYRHEKGIAYTFNQARSAYMAEFLRHWDVNATISNSEHRFSEDEASRLSRSKAIVCGDAHSVEVSYFLRYGCRDAAVALRAKRDAERLSHQGIERFVERLRFDSETYYNCRRAIVFAEGVALVGALTWWLFW